MPAKLPCLPPGGHDQWGRCEELQIRIHGASVPGDLRQALEEDEQPDRDGEREILVPQVPHDEVGVPQEAAETPRNPAGSPFDDEDV